MMRHRVFQIGFSLIVVVGVVFSYWLRLGPEAEFFRALFYAGVPAVASAMSFYAFFVYGKRGGYAPVFCSFATALLLWAVGELLWVYYENILGIDPFPSAADYFYLAAYPFFLIGVVMALRAGEFSFRKMDASATFLMGIIITLGAFILGYFGVYLSFDASAPILNNIISISYSVGDFILLIAILLTLVLAFAYRGGSLMRLWLAIFLAFAMILVADVGFSMYNGAYTSGVWWIKNTLDTLWIGGYLYFALGFDAYAESVGEAKRKLSRKI